jgi:hypothetical protein
MRAKRHTIIVLALALVIYMANIMWVWPVVRDGGRAGRSDSLVSGYAHDSNSYVGSAACASCHKDIYATHIHTAHYLDSRPASGEFIKGSFDKKHNRFTYNSKMEVVMEKKGKSFYQTAFFNGTLLESESIDVVIGSGRKGQTYLYWDGDRLFQLPVSYYTPLNSWCNSPGYPTNLIYFNKQVRSQCIECHGTYARTTEQAVRGTVFDKATILYGIDCERCHGAGAEHIAFHAAHPGEKTGRYILNAARMSRRQRLDACALCHSGLRTPLQPPLTFKTGDSLDNYSTPGYAPDSVGVLDVHANQYGLLTSSKCFRMSRMDCSSCHNVHINEVNSPQVYSARCMNCHNEASHSSCSMPAVRQLALYSNCIDCHMPALPSRKIMLGLSGSDSLVQDQVRTHRIGIYPVSSEGYLEKRRK